ncbi:TonB-dependent receptor [Oceanicoccus sagamiensis]|uniref:TonB-dependent receptor n=1 Tax=Oceanicoccus sagamiensis TaxID=716816 RepID=A0A1X9N7C7_9GAMM|nr:TonB-dependent receptor [Oceanicoccus sagamiensis]ARN73978.1 TonB-dependent receptor [Oceanicoccus sagamiensis]
MFRKSVLASTIGAINIALLSGAVPSIALAQQATVEEVVVTARKREENLQDVPIAITAFTEKTIDRAGIERPQDFIALTPNVTIVDSANAGDTQVTIRGITSTRDAEGTFAYVVDGVLVTNPNGFNGELFDIQQIEVLKGPQGALYGRNAVSGAIIVTTKKPGEEFEGSITGGVGSNELQKVRLTASGPIADGLKGSFAFSNREDDGDNSNSFTGKDGSVDFLEEQNFRGRLIWDVSDRLTLDATASYRDVESGAINFNAVFALPDAAVNFGDPALYKDVNDHEFDFRFNVPGQNEQETTTFSLKADYEMDEAIVTAVFAYDDMEEFLISDGTSAAFGLYSFDFGAGALPPAPTKEAQAACSSSYQQLLTDGAYAPGANAPFFAFPGSVPGEAVDLGIAPFYGLNALLPPYTQSTCDGYQYQQRDQESTSLELRIASKDTDKLSWMGGIYLAQIEREVAVSYGADLGDGFFAEKPFVENRTDLLFWDEFETDVYAIFGSIDYEINAEHSVSLAARYDEEEREVSNNVPNVASAQAFGGGGPINPAYALTSTIEDRDEEFSQFQPKVSWNWGFSEEASMYASYGVGFRSGGFNNLGSSALVESAYANIPTRPANLNDDYEKEVSKSFELGVKSEFMDKRLRVNAAVFHTEVEDSQFFNFLAGGFGILRVVTNIDEVTLQGAEVDFQYLATQNISFYGALGLTDSEIDKNTNRPYTEGNEMPLTPDMTGNLGIQWVSEVAQEIDFVARLDWQYVGETWFSTVQDDTTLNAFTDVSATYQTVGAVFGDVTQTPPGPGIPADGIIGFGTSKYDKGQRDAYDLLNLRLSLEGPSWTLTAWGDNILDEDYLEEIIPAPEFGGYFIHPAKGESYGLDFTYRF